MASTRSIRKRALKKVRDGNAMEWACKRFGDATEWGRALRQMFDGFQLIEEGLKSMTLGGGPRS